MYVAAMSDSAGDGRLSPEEFQQMNALLRRFCTHEPDQWESIQTETPHGPVYVMFSRMRLPGFEDHTFHPF